MSVIGQYKSIAANRPWTARILLAFFVILILLALIRVSLPLAIKMGAKSWFEANGIKSDIGEVEIKLLDGSFAITNVSGKSDTGRGFSLGRFDVKWQWRPLLDNLVVVDSIEVSGLKLDAAFYRHGVMNIAGLEIKSASEAGQAEEVSAPEDQVPGKPWDITIKTIALSDIELCAQQFSDGEQPIIDYCASLAGFDWRGDIDFKASEQDKTPDTPPLYIAGVLNLRGIALNNNLLKRSLLSVDGISVENVKVETLRNVSIDKVDVNNLSALQRKPGAATADAQVAGFDSLSIQPIKLAQLNDLKLGVVRLEGARAYIYIDKGGHTDLAQWIPAKTEKPAEDAPEITATAAEERPFSYSLDKFIFKASKHIVFVDDSLKERFTVDIHSVGMTFGKLDSKTPDDPSHLNLSMTIGEHGGFKLDADLMLLAEKPSIKGKGEIAGLDLRAFAPFTKQYMGHNIRSGQLDADLTLDIDKGIINSNMGLTLNQFELKALSKKEAEKLNSEFGFPLNASLSLLRDRDNAIRLDIPVTGDVDNPEFNPNDAIIKATSKAITAAVLQYYTPFGLVLGAKSLFDLATALRFEPVVYEAGESKLASEHEEQLDKLSKLMAERPGVHLTLCGISNNADLEKLFPVPEKTKQDDGKKGQPAQPEPPSEAQIAELKKIAAARSAGVKNYLVNKKKIKASRLIECAPEFNAANKVAGVEISI